jgi:hypothetical protein
VTRYVPLWTQEAEHPATADRRLIGALWPAGRTLGLEVSAQGNGMILNIGSGAAAVPVANGTGSVLCASDSVEQLELDQPGSSGQNRIDLVVINPRADDIGNPGPPGSGDWIFQAIRGDFGAGAPPVPAGSLDLAAVAVNGGAVTILPGNITDRRPGDLSVPLGLRLPPPVTAGGTQSYTDPTGEVWVARPGVNAGNWRRARDVLHARLFRNGALALGTTAVNIPFDSVTRDPYVIYTGGAFVAPVAGVYQYVGQVAGAPPTNQYLQIAARVNNAIVSVTTIYNAFSNGIAVVNTDRRYLNAGDLLQFFGASGATINAVPGADVIYAGISYLGTG